MLEVRILVNDTEIDTMLIHNMDRKHGKLDTYEVYVYPDLHPMDVHFLHDRSEGYEPLVVQVLNYLHRVRNEGNDDDSCEDCPYNGEQGCESYVDSESGCLRTFFEEEDDKFGKEEDN